MGVLANAKHERFAQEIAKGATADEAYQLAGFAANRGNASRLNSNESILKRVTEIKERVAARVEVSLASVTENLQRIAKKGEELSDSAGLSVSRAAHMDIAKLHGLVVDQSKVDQSAKVVVFGSKPGTADEWRKLYSPEADQPTVQ